MKMNSNRTALVAACGLTLTLLAVAQGPPPGPGGPAAARPRPIGMGTGADDKHVVDLAGADRGKKTYAAECIHCHGTAARGSERGADLMRSLIVLHDRNGKDIGEFLAKGHQTQTTPSANITKEQVLDLSHFLHQRVYGILRGTLEIQDVLTGDAKAGAQYFSGDGKCNTCHSPTGDFKGIGRKYDPPTLQQKFLFPRAGGFGFGGGGGRRGGGPAGKPVTVEVTPAGGKAVSGTMIHLDDFNVSLRDASGDYHSFKRTPQMKIVKNDPYAFHNEMLDKYTDKNMHDIVAYLETLK